MDKDKNKRDMIDEDLYEELDEEELAELLASEREKALQKEEAQRKNPKPKRPFRKWMFWLIALTLAFNVLALLPQSLSIPVIDFLQTSAKLSSQDDIQDYKKAVVVIDAGDSRGTGFAISVDGTILTNQHVVAGEDTVRASFPDDGLHSANVVETYPAVDLAVLEAEGSDFPHLALADHMPYAKQKPIYFIGTPLGFQGIANEGKMIGKIQLSDWDRDVVMIKAPVYKGNSGSPVITMNGKVAGVVFATLKHDQHGKVGLFVPIDYFHDLADK